MQPVIRFENVGKLYRLGTVGTGWLSHDIKRWWITNILHKEDPYLKVGETNDRSIKGSSEYVYALKDINLEVQEGDVLGIIGKNGAGKSTLLKLLSRVTAPTTGKIYTKGRIASLLEVGTGFHPELTGRENIYMNGCILGMKRWEIDKKLDEIVDFSGCERYIDTPVKRYSSGMMVRLGFAVAAHLDPEILVVDEVLAVGDAEFQKKAIGKMQDVSKGQGRTVLFVSHNMGSIKALCTSSIILKNGTIALAGSVEQCLKAYINSTQDGVLILNSQASITDKYRKEFYTKEFEFTNIEMINDVCNVSNEEDLFINFTIHRNNNKFDKLQIGVAIINEHDEEIGVSFSNEVNLTDIGSTFQIKTRFPNHQLAKGKYSIICSLCNHSFVGEERTYDIVYKPISFEVSYVDIAHSTPFIKWPKQSNISYNPINIDFIKTIEP